MLTVHPDYRRHGLARRLVATCFQRCRELGLDHIVISTMPQTTGGIALYESLGFVRQPERDWDVDSRVHLIAYRAPVAR